MSHDYVEMAKGLRAKAERDRMIRRREIIILSLFAAFTIFFAMIG